jgi:hypothetical protein
LPIHKPRSRIVSFRLSEEEYNSLKSVSTSRGARSVSEFTRSVACVNAGNDGMDAIEETLQMINNKMDAIERQLEKLAQIYEELEKTATNSSEGVA